LADLDLDAHTHTYVQYKTFVQKKVVRQVHIVKPEATAGACLRLRLFDDSMAGTD
jgi:hypothetical protein